MPYMIVLLSDPGDKKSIVKQSFRVNIPAELEGRNISEYDVNSKGEWRKNNGTDTVVARSTHILRAGG